MLGDSSAPTNGFMPQLTNAGDERSAPLTISRKHPHFLLSAFPRGNGPNKKENIWMILQLKIPNL